MHGESIHTPSVPILMDVLDMIVVTEEGLVFYLALIKYGCGWILSQYDSLARLVSAATCGLCSNPGCGIFFAPFGFCMGEVHATVAEGCVA
jgi:hypothetical protein